MAKKSSASSAKGAKKEAKTAVRPARKVFESIFRGRLSWQPKRTLPALGNRMRLLWLYMVRIPMRMLLLRQGFHAASPNHPYFRLFFVVLVVALMLFFPWISRDYGITWDEKIQRDYGKEIIEYYASVGKDTSLFDQTKHLYNTMLYYGCSFDVTAGLIHQYVFPWADEFVVRHALNSLYGVFLMVVTALIVRLFAGWRGALICLVLCMVSPAVVGHSMNNPKDIPFAASYVFALYHMLRFFVRFPRVTWGQCLGIVVGIGWTISTRAGGIILIVFFGLFLAVHGLYSWIALKKDFFGAVILRIQYLLMVSIPGYLLGLVMWPYGQKDILRNPWDAVKNLSNVNYLHTYENFAGMRIYMSDVPWYYTPHMILIGTPLVVLLGIVYSMLLVKRLKHKFPVWVYGFHVFIIVFPIAYIVYKHSMVYNGWRHFLFLYMSMLVLASVGWDTVMFEWRKSYLNWGAGLLFVLGIARVVQFMVINHPNQYIYFNELVGGVKGSYGNYELDYYSNSVHQAAKWLIDNEDLKQKKVKVVTNNELLTLSHYTQQWADSMQILWTRDYERQKQDWDYAIFTTRTFTPHQLKNGYFPPKGTLHTIDVDGVPVCAVVKRLDKSMAEGHKLIGEGKWQEGFSKFEYYAKKIDPSEDEAWRMAGLCLLNMDKYDSAMVYLEKTLEINPESFLAYYLKGFYYLYKNKLDLAEESFKKSIVLRINNGDAHAELGNIYLNQSDYPRALTSYQKAVDFQSNNMSLYFNMAIAYTNMGRYEEALQSANIGLSRDPQNIRGYQIVADIFDRAGDPATANQVRQRILQLSGGAQ